MDERVPAHHRLVLPGEAANRQPVDHHVIRLNGQPREGPGHGPGGGLEDVVAVDLPHRRRPERNGRGPRVDVARDLGSLARGQDLGIGGPVDVHPSDRMTAAATTGPAMGPLPTSSTPATLTRLRRQNPRSYSRIPPGELGDTGSVSAARRQARANAACRSAFP